MELAERAEHPALSAVPSNHPTRGHGLQHPDGRPVRPGRSSTHSVVRPTAGCTGPEARSGLRQYEPDLGEGEAVLTHHRPTRAAQCGPVPVAGHRPRAVLAPALRAAGGFGRPYVRCGSGAVTEPTRVAGLPGLDRRGRGTAPGAFVAARAVNSAARPGSRASPASVGGAARSVVSGTMPYLGDAAARGGFGAACQGSRARATAARRAAAGGLTAPASRWWTVVRRMR